MINNFQDNEFEIATATTDEEIKKIGAFGFAKFDERKIGDTVISYYRRPKVFTRMNIGRRINIAKYMISLK